MAYTTKNSEVYTIKLVFFLKSKRRRYDKKLDITDIILIIMCVFCSIVLYWTIIAPILFGLLILDILTKE